MTSVWGPACWAVFHCWPLWAWRPGDTEQAQRFYTAFVHLVRCEACKKHYQQMLTENPPNAKSREALFEWTVDRHNQTNRRLKKNEFRTEDAWLKYSGADWLRTQMDFYKIVENGPKNHMLDWKLFSLWWTAMGLHNTKSANHQIATAALVFLVLLVLALVIWLTL